MGRLYHNDLMETLNLELFVCAARTIVLQHRKFRVRTTTGGSCYGCDGIWKVFCCSQSKFDLSSVEKCVERIHILPVD